MSFTSKATSEILVAGEQATMLVIDTNKGEIVKRVCPRPAAPLTACLEHYLTPRDRLRYPPRATIG